MLHPDLQSQFDALLPGSNSPAGPSRRAALRAALGAGYAAAALPLAAQTAIRTPSDGLDTREITYDVDGFKVPAYVAAPAGRRSLPVVLVVHEIFGVHEYIADVARRFALAGYLAIAPELFARQGDAGSYGEVGKIMSDIVAKVPDAQAMADLDGALGWAASNGGRADKAGITGFCWGGRMVWLYAAHRPGLRAGVAWYGRLSGMASALTPRHALDVAPQLQAPVLGLYGGQDSGIALSEVDRMRAALKAAASQGNAAAGATQFQVYPDAPHAFHADYRPSFRKEAAEDGFARTLAWFRAQGMS
jgi:carboxymethylenebutenolidase